MVPPLAGLRASPKCSHTVLYAPLFCRSATSSPLRARGLSLSKADKPLSPPTTSLGSWTCPRTGSEVLKWLLRLTDRMLQRESRSGHEGRSAVDATRGESVKEKILAGGVLPSGSTSYPGSMRVNQRAAPSTFTHHVNGSRILVNRNIL
jgi:hypothetical protein